MKENKVLFMAQAAMIAAIYVVLCIAFAPISYGAIQARVAEALTILHPGCYSGPVHRLLNCKSHRRKHHA